MIQDLLANYFKKKSFGLFEITLKKSFWKPNTITQKSKLLYFFFRNCYKNAPP